ncbi:NAD(+) diphosphatase [Telluribacter sp. SYSU D00476]|uniref:NAD(+) diphosphatase n=1 Tax=Telluribacter sp. SYSU D00476 TaxID=2811430 RepID=UPI001FF13A23|nr:NAD(+) diphosphatase [Telluribacter sp. SYSU D00476]
MQSDHSRKTNVFAAGTLYRVSESRVDEQYIQAKLHDPAAHFVPVWKNKNLVAAGDPLQSVYMSYDQAAPMLTDSAPLIFLGVLEGIPHFAFALPDEAPVDTLFPAGQQFKDLRDIGVLLTQDEGSLYAYARALVHWHRTHQYCGRCGSKTISQEAGHVLQCTNPACALRHFPRTDAAIIVLITYQEHCLLVRQSVWPEGMYATVAGFLEPGESLENAVAREVMEETGLELEHIEYHSSQPWPFPASIMIGFTAQATTMEYKLDQLEIEQAIWVTREELSVKLKEGTLKLPPPLSIASRLIDDWFRAGE